MHTLPHGRWCHEAGSELVCPQPGIRQEAAFLRGMFLWTWLGLTRVLPPSCPHGMSQSHQQPLPLGSRDNEALLSFGGSGEVNGGPGQVPRLDKACSQVHTALAD